MDGVIQECHQKQSSVVTQTYPTMTALLVVLTYSCSLHLTCLLLLYHSSKVWCSWEALAESSHRCNFLHHHLIHHSSLVNSVELQESFLQNLSDNLCVHFTELSFSKAYGTTQGNCFPYLLITQRTLRYHPPHGMVSCIQVTVRHKKCSVLELMRMWIEQAIESIEDLVEICKMIGNNTKHKFCPGIEMDHYMEEYYKHMGYHIKSVRLTNFHFCRVDSHKCQLFFEVTYNATREEKQSCELKCYPCKCLFTDLEHQKRKVAKETPTRKIKKQRPSSRARLSYIVLQAKLSTRN